jgi:hypothetical protein
MPALNLTAGSTVTLDESANLQNLAATPAVAGDSNDNDIAASSLPTAFSTRLATQNVGAAINAALSGYDGTNTGTNAFTFTVSGMVSDLAFTDTNGALLNGVDSGLNTTDGEDIFLYTDTTNNNIVYGKTALNVVVFAAYLEETGTPVSGAKLWTVQYEAISNPDASNPDDPVNLADKIFVSVTSDNAFSFANVPSGQNLFAMFGNASTAIVVTGKNPANESTGAKFNAGDTVNSSQGGGFTSLGTNNQMIDPPGGKNGAEGMYFTFVSGANTDNTVPNLDQNEADEESSINFTGLVSTTSAAFTVAQLQPNKAATLKISAFTTVLATGDNYVDNLQNNTAVNISSVVVRDSAGNLVTGLSINLNGDTAVISGVKAGYVIEYQTSGGHNRVLIENVGSANKNFDASFDIGGFSLPQTVQSTGEVGSMMVFEDDGPSASLAAATDTVLLNTQDADTIGAATDSDTQDFSTAFSAASVNYGADGPGTTTSSFALGVATQGGDSGLKSDGATIYLYLVGGKVIGSTSATEAGILATNTIFDVAVSAAGSVTLQQFAEIDHALPGDSSNYAAQEATLADTLITLTNTVTVTDGDGDTATDSEVLNIGANIKFDDDGPSVSLAAPTDTVLLNTQDAQTIGANTDSDTQDFSTAFSAASVNYGADGPGTTTSSFALGVATQGGDSGLKSDGATIYLYVVAGKVIGSTSATEAGITVGNTIFDVAVSATGSVTLQQFAEIDHALPGDSSNYAAQEATLADTLITLTNTVTVTDGDGDTATDSEVLNIGANIKFDDDGPSVVLAAAIDTVLLNTQDAQTIGAATDSDTQNFATAFGVASTSYGADGAGTTTSSFALGVATQGGDSGLKSDGATIYLYLVGGKVIGSTSATEAGVLATNTIFDVAVSAAGSVTLQQFAEIDHALPGDSSNYAAQEATLADTLITLTNTVTVTDGDGDTATDSEVLNIGANIKFDDDGPSVVLAAPTDTVLLNTQDAQTIGANTDSDTQDFSTAFGVTSSSYGADGAGSTASTFTLGVSTQGVSSGLTSDGATIRLYLVGGKVIGSTSATEAGITVGNTIFDVAVSGTGSVTLQQFAEIDHALPGVGSNYAAQEATLADTLITLTNSVTVTDGDGDTATDSEVLNIGANIKFDDDGPTVTAISDLTGANDGLPIAGTYNFSVGADDVDNASTDGIVLNSLTGTTGGGRPITDAAVTHFAEDATSVTYHFSFNYYPGPTSTTTQAATGTVVFNKTDGTFAFDMDQLIGGQTTFSTSSPLASFNYDTEGNNSPEIVVQQYSSEFFGVLSARAATPPSDSSDLVAGGNHAFVAGETFNSAGAGFVNVATSTLGVNSDTVQAGELLNFDFYRSNPVSNPNLTSPPPRPGAAVVGTDKAYADAINITIDQITDGEDVAILLKLFDASTNTTTTRLLIANSATDYQSGAGGTKIVSIGEDDYDSATYQIAGVQVLSSTEDLTGTGISLSTHGSVNLTATGMNYADTSDNDVFKIIKIDVVTETTINSDVDLNFGGQLIDGDADFANFDFDVHLEIDGIANLIGTTSQPAVIV